MAKKSTPEVELEGIWADRAKTLRAMSHPVRLLILDALCDGPRCVLDINTLVDIPQPHLSQHIAALRKADLIACHINGPLRCYYVVRPTLIRKLIPLLRQDHPIRERKREIVVREAQQARNAASAASDQ
jgi:ArsR family transcriptional regulator